MLLDFVLSKFSPIFQQVFSFCAKVINEHTKLDQMQDIFQEVH